MGDRHIHRGSPRARTWLTAALATLAASLLLCATAPAAHPSCFGAAARAFTPMCHNGALAVTPTPEEALIMPNSPCAPIFSPTITACTFGAPRQRARGQAALLGDSHAWHWRAAVQYALDRLGWEGFSTTRSSCPYTARMTELPEPKRWECWEWVHAVPVWFEQHPQIQTVFISDHPGAVQRETGQSLVRAQIAGYIEAWRALPPSVRHIVVIRDTPKGRETTLACVESAIQAHQNAGLKCALPRHASLRDDPAQLAARQLNSRRVQVIDLTRFFCDWRLCYPVVGGALVYRDPDHITPVFAATLGPYLLHQLGQLMRSWR